MAGMTKHTDFLEQKGAEVDSGHGRQLPATVRYPSMQNWWLTIGSVGTRRGDARLS